MNTTESLTITRFVRAVCPQQKFDEYTPDAWHQLLSDLQFTDCKAAIEALGKRQTFISPAEIRGEVRRIRNARLERAFEDIPEVDANPNDTRAFLDALRSARKRIANGEPDPVRPELPRRPVAELVEAAAKRTAVPPSCLMCGDTGWIESSDGRRPRRCDHFERAS